MFGRILEWLISLLNSRLKQRFLTPADTLGPLTLKVDVTIEQTGNNSISQLLVSIILLTRWH